MKRIRIGMFVGLFVLPITSFSQTSALQPPKPKLEAVAETHLLMQGLMQSNFRGVSRILKDKPTDVEAWTFARGQVLIIAETGNLLMLRPPRNQGSEAWMQRSTELRESASRTARNLAARDYQRSRAGVVEMANICNRCHQTFRVKVEVTPFGDGIE